jgi:hypothetical protein
MIPNYKIMTYTGAVNDHTITSDAIRVYFKEILTSGIGYFIIVLPGTKDITKVYDDIAPFDLVKIWMWDATDESCPTNPHFVGRVLKTSADGDQQNGYMRTISGFSQGEILQRLFKTNKYYDAVTAHTIADEIADDLSLGKDTDADATAETIEVRTITYFDLLQEISDYYDAGGSVTKDFYVYDNAGTATLGWKTRPIRTAGISTLTEGGNITTYNVTRSVEAVKNSITVYGKAESPLPSDRDLWTEDDSDPPDNWSASEGSVTAEEAGVKIGAHYVHGLEDNVTNKAEFKRVIDRVTIRNINKICFWERIAHPLHTVPNNTFYLRLHCPDNSNYYETPVTDTQILTWNFQDFSIGPSQVYDADDNPNGIWTPTGSPNWWDIQAIEFYALHDAIDLFIDIDGLYFFPERWSYTITDAASITAYGQRDLEVTDDNLHSDADCEVRAKTLLYQLKDMPIELDLTLKGDNNILVGDRIPVTLQYENLSAVDFDVISVEQNMDIAGWVTKPKMVNNANIRKGTEKMPIDTVGTLKKVARMLNYQKQMIT